MTSEYDETLVGNSDSASKRRIYLDAAASTAVKREVLDTMLPLFSQEFANPSAHHTGGRTAAAALSNAREKIAKVLGSLTEEIVFTSGGTESINAGLKGVAFAQREAGVGTHIVTSAIEHHAVLHSMQYLERFGFEVEIVPVNKHGHIDPAKVSAAIREDTVLVSVMYANNEVGTVQPLPEIVAAVREREKDTGRPIPFHTDAVQAATSLPLNVDTLGIDLLSLSGHKFGGPKGVGLLYLRRGIPFLEQISGGGQERQRRSGTENVPGVAGFAMALELAQAQREEFAKQTSALRDRLSEKLCTALPGVHLNGHPVQRLPHNLHLSFEGVEGESIVDALDEVGIECSAGAACTSATWEPSHVLLAMGVPLELAIGSVRITLWPDLSNEDIDYVVEQLPAVVTRLRTNGMPVL